MAPVVYIDVLFLVNWVMNLVVLSVAGRLWQRQIRLGRIGLAAALGAVWFCSTVLFPEAGWLIKPVGIIGITIGMIQLAYPCQSIAWMGKGILYCFLAAVLVGGIVHVIYDNTAMGRFFRVWLSGNDGGAVSVWLLAVAVLLALCAVNAGMKYQQLSAASTKMQEVTLCYRERTVTCIAFLDSGNQLYDPFTHSPVHVLEEAVWMGLLGEVPSDSMMVRFRWIPCRSVGNPHGYMQVITIDRLLLADGRQIDRPVIGLSHTALSGDHHYQLLLHGTFCG